MDPAIRSVIRAIEQQRNDLLSGMSITAAFEKMASREAEAVFAAEKAKARVAELEKQVAELSAKPKRKAKATAG